MPLHPLVVHFPIVLIITAGVFYFLSLFIKDQNFARIAFYLHVAGILGALAAIFTGDSAEHALTNAEAIDALVDKHEAMGQLSTWGFGLLGVWAYLRQQSNIRTEKIVYITVFWALVGLMAYSAHLGGQMVYEHGAGVEIITP